MEDSKYLNYLDFECTDTIETPVITYPFPLDNFQRHAHFRTSQNENVLVTAHTGSGKTIVAEYGIAQAVNNNKRVIYTSPIKSLSNQKYNEFKKKFPDVGILTGDIKFNPDAQCMIITTEILRNILYRYYVDKVMVSNTLEGIVQPMDADNICENPFLEELRNSLIMTDPKKYIESIECVIFDEVHYINNKERGKVWEETIVMLPSEINLIMLSATIDESKKFASWIGDIKKKPINLIPTKSRPIPLRHYIYLYHYDKKKGDTEKYLELSNTIDKVFNYSKYDEAYSLFKSMQNDVQHNDLTILNRLIEFMNVRKQFPVIFFTFSRKKCEQYAKFIRAPNLVDSKESSEIANIFDFNMSKYKDTYQKLPQYEQSRSLLIKGVGVHHSGLMPILKEVIEILFSKGLIKILFATETFAVGVNMPTKTVVYTELDKYTDSTKRYLHPDEYQQMSGRAGRRGLDTTGTVIYCPIKEMVSKAELSFMMMGNSPKMISKFSLNYSLIMKLYLQNKQEHILDYVQKSLYSIQLEDDLIKMKNELKEKQREINEYPKDWSDDAEKYYQLDMKIKSNNKMKQNQLKKFRKEMSQIENNSIHFKESLDKYKNYSILLENKNNIENAIEVYPKLISKDLQKNIWLLEKNGFIKDNKITLKGLYATEINDCNEILLTEILYNNWFKDSTKEEIVCLLSMFIQEGQGKESDILPQSLDITKNVIDFVYYMNDVVDYYIKQEEEYQIQSDSIWMLNLGLMKITYLWVSGKTIDEIYQYMEIYEGNFIRSMIQINNLVQSIMNICEMVGDNELYKKLEDTESMLIRDIVTLDSLYIHS